MKTVRHSLLAVVLVLMFIGTAHAGATRIQVRPFVGLFGGGNALDGISGYTIHPDDQAVGHDGTGVTWYVMFPQDSGATTESTSPPYRVCPDSLQAGGGDAVGGTTTWVQGAVGGATIYGQVIVVGTFTIDATKAAQWATLAGGSPYQPASGVTPLFNAGASLFTTGAALTAHTAGSPWATGTALTAHTETAAIKASGFATDSGVSTHVGLQVSGLSGWVTGLGAKGTTTGTSLFGADLQVSSVSTFGVSVYGTGDNPVVTILPGTGVSTATVQGPHTLSLKGGVLGVDIGPSGITAYYSDGTVALVVDSGVSRIDLYDSTGNTQFSVDANNAHGKTPIVDSALTTKSYVDTLIGGGGTALTSHTDASAFSGETDFVEEGKAGLTVWESGGNSAYNVRNLQIAEGTNITVTVTDSGSSSAVLTINSTASGGGGGSATTWWVTDDGPATIEAGGTLYARGTSGVSTSGSGATLYVGVDWGAGVGIGAGHVLFIDSSQNLWIQDPNGLTVYQVSTSGASGAFTTLNAPQGINSGRSDTPTLEFRDAQGTDDEANAQIDMNLTATGSGAEDADLWIRQHIAGNMVVLLYSDADGVVTLYKQLSAVSGFRTPAVFSYGTSGQTIYIGINDMWGTDSSGMTTWQNSGSGVSIAKIVDTAAATGTYAQYLGNDGAGNMVWADPLSGITVLIAAGNSQFVSSTGITNYVVAGLTGVSKMVTNYTSYGNLHTVSGYALDAHVTAYALSQASFKTQSGASVISGASMTPNQDAKTVGFAFGNAGTGDSGYICVPFNMVPYGVSLFCNAAAGGVSISLGLSPGEIPMNGTTSYKFFDISTGLARTSNWYTTVASGVTRIRAGYWMGFALGNVPAGACIYTVQVHGRIE